MPSTNPDPAIDLREEPDGVIVPVIVLPRSSRNGIVGIHDGAVKIRIAAPPVEGRANAACIAFLAKKLRVPKGNIEIIRGAGARKKWIQVTGIKSPFLLSRLNLQG